MAFKTITVSEEAYTKLKRLKGKGESFTDVILKMDRARGDISRYAGAWSDMPNDEARRLESSLREFWGRWRTKGSA